MPQMGFGKKVCVLSLRTSRPSSKLSQVGLLSIMTKLEIKSVRVGANALPSDLVILFDSKISGENPAEEMRLLEGCYDKHI